MIKRLGLWILGMILDDLIMVCKLFGLIGIGLSKVSIVLVGLSTQLATWGNARIVKIEAKDVLKAAAAPVIVNPAVVTPTVVTVTPLATAEAVVETVVADVTKVL